MDKQDTLRNLLLAAAVFFAVMALSPYLFPTRPQPTSITDTAATSPTPPGAGTDEAQTSGDLTIAEADAPIEIEIGASADTGTEKAPPSPYRIRALLSNVGAGLTSLYLADHAEKPGGPERYQLLHLVERDGRVERSYVVEKVNLDGVDVALNQRMWQGGAIEPHSPDPDGAHGQKVSFHLEVSKNAVPALRITRTFYLPQQSVESGRQDMWSAVSVENLTQDPQKLVLTLRGAAGVSQRNGSSVIQNVDLGLVGAAGYFQGLRKAVSEVHGAPDQRLVLYRYSADDPLLRLSWLSIDNTYFAAIEAPLAPDRTSAATYVAEAVAYDLDRSAATTDDLATAIITAPQSLPPGETLTFESELYLGEKDRYAFKDVSTYTSRNYFYLLTAGVTWCTFSWLVELMIWLLNGLYFIVHDFGVAIIILVIIVRFLLHPITKKGQINMVRMQKKAGEVSALVEEAKKKFGNDKARLQQETMRIYREVGVNPAGQMLTCLPMLIQMPIWVALFFSLSNNVLIRHKPFHFTWIHDLTAPDALIPFSAPFHVPIVGWQIASFNLLPILVAIFMYVQQKTQPRPEPNANMSEQQRQQQDMMFKMMPIMSIMMLFIFYPMPAGLNLYVMCSSLFGWIEQRRIRTHIKEHEAAGTLHKPPKEKNPAEPRKLPGWLQKLQSAAEEAQKAQRTQRRDKGKPRR